MGIIVNKKTIAICQGMTGRAGRLYSRLSLEYNTNIVAGVNPSRSETTINGVPIYATVREVLQYYPRIDASLIFVPPVNCKEAILEALENKISIIVCITEGIPIHDMLAIKVALRSQSSSIFLGPNSPGIISVGHCLLGIMPQDVFKQGNIGIISRSGTLMYEVAQLLSKANMGQSTCIGIGGDPIIGTDFVTMIKLLQNDVTTRVIVLLGEIGGSLEEEAAMHLCKTNNAKPIISYIAGTSAPYKTQMGHAGAIIYGDKSTAASKKKLLKESGSWVANRVQEIPLIMQQFFA